MKLAEADRTSGYRIEGYDAGTIRIAGQTYRQGLIVTPHQIQTGWGPAAAADLTADHLSALLAFAPQLVLLGTGRRQVFPAAAHLAILFRQGIGIEVMDTGAACRTYNILMAEGRQVVAGLMIAD